MSNAAPTRTFAIFELAEAIFLELPMRDLLVHQRTCKQWQAVMLESSKLQEAMFFKPATTRALVIHEGRSINANSIIFSHPLIRSLVRPLEDPTGTLERPEASWRRQLITQPPVAEVFAGLSLFQGLRKTITARAHGVTMGEVARVFGDYRTTKVHFRGASWWSLFNDKDVSAHVQVGKVKGVEYDGFCTWEEDEESESDEEELDGVEDDAS